MRVKRPSSVAFSSAVRLDTEYGLGNSFSDPNFSTSQLLNYLTNTFRISACFFSR